MAKANNVSKPAGVKSRKRLILKITGITACVVLVVVAILGYIGFIPGVAEAMQTNKPVDLDVRYTAADYKSLMYPNSDGVQVSNFDYLTGASKTTTASGSKLVVYGGDTNQNTFTQEQLTAFLNTLPWTGSPLSNSQVRLTNGTVEYSGNVQAWYVSSLVKSLYPSGNYGQLGPFISLASHLDDPAVYVKAQVSVDNVTDNPSHGRLHLKVLALKINRMDLTSDVANMKPLDMSVGEASWQKGLGYSLGWLKISDGKVDTYGTIPTSFSVGNGDPNVECTDYHGGSLIALSPIDGHIGTELKQCP